MIQKNDQKIFDVEFARSQFPFFDLPQSKDWAFFDNAGGTFPCRAVVDKLTHFYTQNKVQPYGDNALAAAAGEQMDLGRKTIAELMGVAIETITIGPSTTQNFNTLALACHSILKADDEIIVTEQDHESNIGSWQRVAEKSGAKLKFWQVNQEDGELALADFEKLLSDRVKIISVTQSSNIIGSINPINEITELGHQVGAKVVIDGVSFAPHCWPNLADFKADAYCFSTYKTYATHLGIIHVKPDFLEQLEPQCHFFNVKKPGAKLDTAGPDHASIAALAGLGDYFCTLYAHHFSDEISLNKKAEKVSTLMHQHETELCSKLLKELNQLPVRIIGKTQMENREANVSFMSKNHSSATMAKLLAEKGVATKHGHFYAYRLLEKMGIDSMDGVLRLSFAHYNTNAEIEKMIQVLKEILREPVFFL